MDRTDYHNGFEVPIRVDLAKQNCGLDTRHFVYCILHLLGSIFLFKTIFIWEGVDFVYCRFRSVWYILGREKVLKILKITFYR